MNVFSFEKKKIVARVAPALLRQATYGSLKLGFYHALKRKLVKNTKGEGSDRPFA